MGWKRLSTARMAARSCLLGLCAWALSCGAKEIKGIGGSHGAPLPGAEYLLPKSLGKTVAGALAHGTKGKPEAAPEDKGTVTVAAGINAFLRPATSQPVAGRTASNASMGATIASAVAHSGMNKAKAAPGDKGITAVGAQINSFSRPVTNPPVVKGVVSTEDTVTWSGETAKITAPEAAVFGTNLFETFTQFNLTKSEVADFIGPASVTDIIARVTGEASSIDGTIESSIKGANLFLINPFGVIFGANASLSLTGAFTVSTADYVNLSGGGTFVAAGGTPTNRTSGAVNGFGWTAAPAPVYFMGSRLSVPVGKGLNVIAGNVTLDSATGTAPPGAALSAPSGALTIFSAASTGEVPFSLNAAGAGYGDSSLSTLGDVILRNGSSIAISGAGGGMVIVEAGSIKLDDSAISSVNTGSVAGGGVDIDATTSLALLNNAEILCTALGAGNAGDVNASVLGAVTMMDGGNIKTSTSAAGDAGNVNLAAVTMDIDGSANPAVLTGIAAGSFTTDNGSGGLEQATGKGGNVDVKVSGELDLTSGGRIKSGTNGPGDGGNVIVSAGTLVIDGMGVAAGATVLTGIATSASQPAVAGADAATGSAGDLKVTAGDTLAIMGGGEITASTTAPGNAGNVTVSAESLGIDGSKGPVGVLTGIIDESGTPEDDSGGNAGAVTVNVAHGITIEAAGEIMASTYSNKGTGGDVNLRAGSLKIDGANAPGGVLTGIIDESGTPEDSNGGNAGTVMVTVEHGITIEDAGEIMASTYSKMGSGGDTDIQAGSLEINGANAPGGILTGIIDESGTPEDSSGGMAGKLIVTVDQGITIQAGGQIMASTYSTIGSGGDLGLEAASLEINGANAPAGVLTGIIDQSGTPGDSTGGTAGTVDISVTGMLSLENAGEINAATYTRNNGGVTVAYAETVDMAGSGRIFSSTYSSGKAGNVTLTADSMNVNGSANPAVATGILAGSEGNGPGGNVNVTVNGALDIDNGGRIKAGANAGGDGGSVTVKAETLAINGKGTSTGPTVFTGITAESQGVATGNAGNVMVTVTGNGLIADGGQIMSDTFYQGSAGNVTVLADGSLVINGVGTPGGSLTGIFGESEPGASGKGGDVTVKVTSNGALSLASGGEINASTFSTGAGGNVMVQAGSLDIDGANAPIDPSTMVSIPTGIFDQSGNSAATSGGSAGSLTVHVSGGLTMESTGRIFSATYTPGNGGDVTVTAGSMNINGSANPSVFTGIIAGSSTAGSGKAGDVKVKVNGSLDIESGGRIKSGTNSANPGGTVTVTAGSLDINGVKAPAVSGAFTGITAESQAGATGNAGDLSVTVTRNGALTIMSGGEIMSDTYSAGLGGKVMVQTGSLVINGANAQIDPSTGLPVLTGILGESESGATKSAQNVTVVANGSITIERGGEISAATSSSGNAGQVIVDAGSLMINGAKGSHGVLTGILDQSGTPDDYSTSITGAAGDVIITVGGLILESGGEINASTFAAGTGGNVTIQTGFLDINGADAPIDPSVGTPILTGIFDQTGPHAGMGSAGEVTVTVTGNGALTMEDGGEIQSATHSAGNAGNVTVTAGSMNINGFANPAVATGILAGSAGAGMGGTADVTVSGALDIEAGGRIKAGANASGNGGTVIVKAGSLNINGAGASTGPTVFTGITAQSLFGQGQTVANGNAGTVTVTSNGALDIASGGEIIASTSTPGGAGNVTVKAGSLDIDGADAPKGEATGILAESTLGIAGNAGLVNVQSGELTLENRGTISTRAVSANAGSVTIDANSTLTLETNGSITASSGGLGGDINISVPSFLYVYHSSIVATAGNGPGGNITIDPEFAIIYDSLISANDASGGEGNIHLNATYLFESGSQIFATGVVESPIPSADLTGALVLLNGAPVDAETRLEDTCAVEVQGDFSSFLELGQGDIEAAPNEAQGQTGDAGRHARHQTQARKVKAWHPAMIQL